MGTGASNQVRSECTKVEKLRSPSLSADNSTSRFQPATKDVANRSVANSKSDIVTHLDPKPCKIQKSQLTIKPSQQYGHQKDEGDNEASVDSKLTQELRQKIHELELANEASVDSKLTQELRQKIHELELALAVSDSQRLDLQDQLQVLEEKLIIKAEMNTTKPADTPRTLYETLNAKDLHIKNLESELKNAQTDFQKRTSKLKKHIRALRKQIFELRHEALITQMELKSQPHDSAESNKSKAISSSNINEMSIFGAESNIGHTKIIIELSNQLSEQGEQIDSLKAEVAEKHQRIEHLETVVREMRNTSAVSVNPPSPFCENSAKDIINTERLTSAVGEKYRSYFSHPAQALHGQAADVTSAYTKNFNGPVADSHPKSRFRHQTTSLSDSDSDWDEGLCLSQGTRHSAPARGRIKNHNKSDLSIKHTSSIRSKPEVNLHNGDNYLSNSLAVLNTAASNNVSEAKEQL